MKCTALFCESQDEMGEHRESAHQRHQGTEPGLIAVAHHYVIFCVSCFFLMTMTSIDDKMQLNERGSSWLGV